MAKSGNCPECGAPLPAGAPGGFCPQCLIALGLEEPVRLLAGRNRQVGPYRILDRIGEGGMGDVYLAEQQAPIRRRVALKIIKLGMDTRQVIARFESERQALALMDHPNIASVLDAGEHEGRPYFVMEYVQGMPITEYCDRHRLSTDERLDLFSSVCQAIQHAHQKGIIHRDIKPSNVLVALQDGAAVPKIIDFGVAKATSQRLTEKTLYTQHGLMIGTPEYMSPEQAEFTGLDVDTRTDIYSLGVLLYELLTGVLPFDAQTLREAGFEEVRRIIRENNPEKPTTKLEKLEKLGDTAASIARQRHTDLKSLSRQLRGDLEWITLKALEKDRGRRYPTASALAADLERHRNHDPVMAGPPSRAYRVGKFVRKHRLPVIAAASVVLTALAFGSVASWFGIRAVQSEQAAVAARVEADAALDFLLTKLLRMADPLAQIGRLSLDGPGPGAGVASPDVSVLEVVEWAAGDVSDSFGDHPLVEATIREAIGGIFAGLGRYADARGQFLQALVIRERTQGTDNLETLATAVRLGVVIRRNPLPADYFEAGTLARQVIEDLRTGPGYDNAIAPAAISLLVSVFGDSGYRNRDDEVQAAVSFLKELVDEMRVALGDDHPATAIAMSGMATLYLNLSSPPFAEAEALLEPYVERQIDRLGDDHPVSLQSGVSLARVYVAQGRHQDTVRLLAPIVTEAAIARALDGGPETLQAQAALKDGIDMLGQAHRGLGNLELAAGYMRQSQELVAILDSGTTAAGSSDVTRVRATDFTRRLNVARATLPLRMTEGRIGEAEEELRTLLDDFQVIRVPSGQAGTMAMLLAGQVRMLNIMTEQPQRSSRTWEEILRVFAEKFGPTDAAMVQLMISMADLFSQDGEHDRAIELFAAAIELRAAQMGQTNPMTDLVRTQLSRAYDRRYRALASEGRLDEARASAAQCADLYTEWLQILTAVSPLDAGVLRERIMDVRGVAYAMAGEYAHAEVEFRHAVSRLQLNLALPTPRADGHLIPAYSAAVGWTQYLNGDYPAAEATMRDAMRDAEDRNLTDQPDYFRILAMLGAILAAQDRFDDAEGFLLSAYEVLADLTGERLVAVDRLGFELVRFLSEEIPGERLRDLYVAWGRDDLAAVWSERVATALPTYYLSDGNLQSTLARTRGN